MSLLSGAFGLRSSTKQICVIMGTWTPVCGVTPVRLWGCRWCTIFSLCFEYLPCRWGKSRKASVRAATIRYVDLPAFGTDGRYGHADFQSLALKTDRRLESGRGSGSQIWVETSGYCSYAAKNGTSIFWPVYLSLRLVSRMRRHLACTYCSRSPHTACVLSE